MGPGLMSEEVSEALDGEAEETRHVPGGHDGSVEAKARHELWSRWAEARSPRDRDELIAAYGPLVRRIAVRCFRRRVSRELELADFMQHGNVGLLEAIERYDTGRGVRFETYAQHRIEGAILNGVQSLSELQQQVTVRRQVLKERTNSVIGGTPEDRSALERLAEVAIALAMGFMLDDEGQPSGIERAVADNAYTRVEMRQLRQEVAALVHALPEQERVVIHRHYFQQVRFEEIAASMGLTKGRISQVHHAGLGRLRQLHSDRGKKRGGTSSA